MGWILFFDFSFFEPGFIQYFVQSNRAGQGIVLLLVCFSVVAWTLMGGKYLELKRDKRLNQSFEDRLEEVALVLNLDLTPSKSRSDYAKVCRGAVQAYLRYGSADSGEEDRVRMSHIENAIQRVVNRSREKYESKMIFLGSIITGAPFTGLLGTVWGVMDAFGGIALQGDASLQTLAPGVSGALLTTVVALLVAIPSVFGYNILLDRVRTMTTDLENYGSSLADRIELEARERIAGD